MSTEEYTKRHTYGQYDSYRIIVELKHDQFEYGDPERIHETRLARLKEVQKNIRRHIDDIGYNEIDVKMKTCCKFCNYDPEADPIEGPVCCNKAIAAWDEMKAEAK